MAGYLGNTQKISGRYTVDEFTSSGGTTYTLSSAPGDKNNIQVSAGGLVQYPSAYSVSGTTLTLSGVPSGQKVVVRHMGDTIPFPLLDDNVVTTAKIAAGAVGTTDIADDAVTLAKLSATGTASSSNFLRGDNSWQAAGGGAWNMVGTSEASTSASLTVTGLDSTYDNYAIGISDMTPDSDTNNAYLRLGDSSGIDSGGSDYAWHLMRNKSDNSSYSGQVNNSTSSIQMAAGGTVAGEGMGAMLYLNRPADGTLWPIIHGTCVGRGHATSQLESGVISGVRLSGISVDRVQIFWGAGNIVTGRLTVWGISHT